MNAHFVFRLAHLTVCLLGPALLQSGRTAEAAASADLTFTGTVTPLLKQFCFDCHSDKKTKGQINLERMTVEPDFAGQFKSWEKIIAMLEQKEMPPDDELQPNEAERAGLIAGVRQALDRSIQAQAGDPGNVTLQRLTSAEYAYTIQDLTGLELGLEQSLADDAVGGEGFSNVGDVQFIQDSALERYLEAARTVAARAVMGAGPLRFYRDPGQTGQELSAIHRIHEIYRKHGFRTGAGEGAVAFGLDLYPKAFHAVWRFQHRHALGVGDLTLAEMARKEGLDVRFVEHLWAVLNDPALTFPSGEIAAAWRRLPVPTGPASPPENEARARCELLHKQVRDWQGTLSASSANEEEFPVLSEDSFRPVLKHSFRSLVSWPRGATNASVDLAVVAAGGSNNAKPVVVWRQGRLRFRQGFGGRRNQPGTPLQEVVSDATGRTLRFGDGPNGATVNPGDFVTEGSVTLRIEFPVPRGATQAELQLDAELDLDHGDDCLVRCVISSAVREGATAAATGTFSALLANPDSTQIHAWKTGAIDFARKLPQISHREPTPSDRDPIPAPYDNGYNNAERNDFHYAIKYHRDDRFLTEHILDPDTRARLDEAWTDLLTSFDYHQTFLRFVVKKFKLDLEEGREVGNLSAAWMDRLPDEPRRYVKRLHEGYADSRQALNAAQPGHLDDALRWAALAWRRPLDQAEESRLRGFYARLRGESKLEHPEALRSLLARILVSPAFLYRAEGPGTMGADNPPSDQRASSGTGGSISSTGELADEEGAATARTSYAAHKAPSARPAVVPLSDWELASRLSYFLWASIPDAELRRAASAGELRDPAQLARQAQRMLRDSKARRLAAEFFGQWFGFYRFDGFRGIDPGRFPEFTDAVKAALHEEAVSLFEYIVREDRPVDEILFADYAFLNSELARHYGIEEARGATNGFVRVEGVSRFKRGGLLRLGAVHAVTSAPLRTSAVKRGDWVLRRVLGTPVPPPPGDAGSIPPDDVLSDGQTVRRRLDAHRREASCVNCHARIDPFGFALENFDPIGRWRNTYRDGQEIETSGTLHDGTEISGMADLDEYLRTHVESFHRTLCAKLLGYALGRSELVSDRPLLEQMSSGLKTGGRFSTLVAQIVGSTQFRHRRSTDGEQSN